MELSNLDGVARPVDYELDWHTDQTYTPRPVFGTILYGIVAPRWRPNIVLRSCRGLCKFA